MNSYYSIIFSVCLIFLFSLSFLNFTFQKVGFVFSTKFVFDKISVYLVLLVCWVVLSMVLAMPGPLYSKGELLKKTVLLLGVFLICAFCVKDFFWFFFFFEISLLPTFIIILGWGNQPERISASFYLMSYTLFGSLPLLIGLMNLFSKDDCLNFYFWGLDKKWFFFCDNFEDYSMIVLFWVLGFLMKLPIFGLHIWLTKAHVEAPVVGSMMLAGVLLKLGSYGLYRILTMWELNMVEWVKFFSIWVVASMVLVSFICFRQKDLKSLIAYSSVVHMSVTLIGVLVLNSVSTKGFLMLLMAHGVCSSGLFFMVNMFYELSGSRSIVHNRGFHLIFPILVSFWLLFSLVNSSLPPSLKMFSEIFLFSSVITFSKLSFPFMLLMVFLKGLFSVYLYLVVSHGKWNTLSKNWNAVNFRLLKMCAIHALIVLFLFLFKKVIV